MSSVNLHWLAENFANQDPVVFDIGCANMSDTLNLKRTLTYYKSPGAKFYAFDCNQTWLEQNTLTAKQNNVEYHHLALSDTNGSVTFYPSEQYQDRDWPWAGSIFKPGKFYNKWVFGQGYTVDSVTLSTFCQQHNVAPDFIHIDVQGAEFKILNNLIVRPKCIWTEICEFQRYNDTGITYYDFDKMLFDQGYTLLYRNAHDALYVDSQLTFTSYNHHYKSAEIEHTILTNIWLEKYQLCRGDEWPEVSSMDDYTNLPLWIKQECIQFGIDVKNT